MEARQLLRDHRATATGHALEGRPVRLSRKIAPVLAMALAVGVGVVAAPTAAQNDDVAARDLSRGKSLRCPDLTTSAYPLIQGGCIVLAAPTRIDLTVQTMFGPLRFARCSMAFNLHIGADGRVWQQGMSIDGSGACGDILPCREKAPAEKIHLAAKLPWKGQIRRASDGRLQGNLELCFDTCLGRFEGKTAFDLLKERGDWTLRAAESVAGSSGFELEGKWELDAASVGTDSAAYIKRGGAGAPGFDLR